MNRRITLTTTTAAFGLLMLGGLALAQDRPLQNNSYENSPTGYTVSGDKQQMEFYGKSSRLILEHRSLPAATKQFMRDVAITNKAEIMLGQLALQKSANDKIKEFAQKMIDDHTTAQSELSKLAANDDVNLPDSIDAQHQALYDRLNSLSGDAFDRAYIKAMVMGHDKATRMFQKASNNGHNSDVRMWAASTTSLIRKHRDMARDIASSTGV